MEEWRQLKQNENYSVSNTGKVRNDRNGHLLKGRLTGNTNYLIVVFSIGGKRKVQAIHRMVAICFIKNPDNKPCVNHKDGDKHNNHHSNLEWATYSENNQHSYNTGLKKYRPLHYKGKKGYDHNRSKEVFQYDTNGIIVGTFGSISEAFRITGISYTDISKVALGKMYSAGGFIWSYKMYKKSEFPERPKHHLSKSVGMYNYNGELVKTFESCQKAADYFKCHQSCISDAALGNVKRIKGHFWKYI